MNLEKQYKLLQQGVEQLPVVVSTEQQQQLMDYLRLLIKWNKAYNLTAVRDPNEMVIRHLLDSLTVLPWIKGNVILDVGTGAGIPGFPLSIMYPEKQFQLLDSNGKKTRFLIQAKTDLKRDNIAIVKNRIEQFKPTKPIDAIVCRAFSSLIDFVDGIKHLVNPSTELLAMKGVLQEEELQQLPMYCEVKKIIKLDVPLLDEERHLVILNIKEINK